MDSPLAGSKKCSRVVSTASSSGCAGPDAGPGRHPRGPQRLAAGQRGDGLVLFLVAVGGAADRGVLDRRRVDREDHVDLRAEFLGHPDGDPIRGHDASPSEASSKSDGRMPRMTFFRGTPSSPGLAPITLAGTGSRYPAKVTAGPSSRTRSAEHEVHRGGADEAGHEQVHRRRRTASAACRPAAGARRSARTPGRPSVMASTWSWVTYTVVVPSRSCSWFSAARIDTRSLASRLDSGSSIRNAAARARSPGPSPPAAAGRRTAPPACGSGTGRDRASRPRRGPAA